MNPVIKFTTLFGLLAVELAVSLTARNGNTTLTHILALVFFLVSVFFVWRSFHGMRIGGSALERRPVEEEIVKSVAGD
jgi:K(+)-stimulated pyrophosphate-energized sodium pump